MIFCLLRRQEDREEPRAVQGRQGNEIEDGQDDVDRGEGQPEDGNLAGQSRSAMNNVFPLMNVSETAKRAPIRPDEGQQQVHHGPRESHDGRPEALGAERRGPELDRLAPAEADQDDHRGSEGIQVACGVEASAGPWPGGGGRPGGRRPGVGVLVEGDGEDEGDRQQ